MLVRNALLVGSLLSFASLALACGAPPDGVGKDGKGVGGSPNDPGWTPPGANNGPSPDDGNPQPGDDQGEQPTNNPPPNCPPMALADTPQGFMVHTVGGMTIDTPASWPTPAVTDPTADGGASFEQIAPLGGGVGYVIGMNDMPSRLTLDQEVSVAKAILGGKTGTARVVTVTNMMFGCDPAVVIEGVREGNDVKFLAVLHEGHVFDASCEALGTTADATLCDRILATWRITK